MQKKYKMQENGKRKKTTPPPAPTVQFRMENGSVVATMEPGVTPEQIAAHRAQMKEEAEKPQTDLEKLLAEKTKSKDKETEEVCESPTPTTKE